MPKKNRNRNKNFRGHNDVGGSIHKGGHYQGNNNGVGGGRNHFNKKKSYFNPSIISELNDEDTVMQNNENRNGAGSGYHQHGDNYRRNKDYKKGKNRDYGKKLIEKFKDVGVEVKSGQPKLGIGDSDVDVKKTLIPSKEHCNLSYLPDDVFKMIVTYVQNYFMCFDSNRESLLDAYNQHVNFSLTLNLSNSVAYRSFRFDDLLVRESRNLRRLCGTEDHHDEKRFKLLHLGKIDTLSVLCKMPPTEHDPTSFKLDSCYFSPTLITFCLSGVFKEGKPTDKVRPMRSFSRSFVCIPDSTYQMTIVNEQYTISNITGDQYKKYFSEQAKPTAPANIETNIPINGSIVEPITTGVQQPIVAQPVANVMPTPELNEQQILMVKQFSLHSRLNLEWSKFCLQDAQWNYETAGQNFLNVKSNIPPEAFLPA